MLLICGWFFVLGITVGRGLIPVVNSQNDIQQELLAAREKAQAKQAQAIASSPELDFHEALKDDSTHDIVPDAGAPPAHPSETPLPAKTAEKYKPLDIDSPPEPLEKPASQPTAQVSASEKIFAVQVAALRGHSTAMELTTKLEKAGFSVYVIKVELAADNVWYRVRSGAFSSREEAAPLLDKLKHAGYEPILVKRQNKT